jgi:hypothetical protein
MILALFRVLTQAADPKPRGTVMRKSMFAAVLLGGSLSGCELAGDIFQAGVAVGVILVIAVIALLAWIFYRVKS